MPQIYNVHFFIIQIFCHKKAGIRLFMTNSRDVMPYGKIIS